MAEIIRISCGNGNAYIVAKGKKAILVDTGKKEYLDTILEACQNYEMELIVLTHGHFDHAENARELSNKWKIPIAMNKKDYELIANNFAQKMQARNLLGKAVLGFSKKDFKTRHMPEFEPDIFLQEGDSLTDYGISGTILELPGHTKGSIGVLIDKKDLIVGDALMNMFYPTVSMLYYDRKQMLASAKRISDLGNITIHYGHGKSIKRCKRNIGCKQ